MNSMTQDEYVINLDLPPSLRWSFLVDHTEEINELLSCYLNDFEGADFIFDSVEAYKQEVISKDYLEEIEFIASISNYSPDQVLIANLYYDVLKFYLGCTAFAVEHQGGILHARNLDWWTDNDILGNYSKVFDFQRGGKTVFKTIGWFGFIGALSGTKPHGFSLTLNAVSSKDQAEIAVPVSFLLRDVLDACTDYDEAKEKLESTIIASDCLILLSGIREHEMVVVERSPKRFATRIAQNGYVVVTNDYKELENNVSGASVLQSTSCSRYERTVELLKANLPVDSNECFKILRDDKVLMGITVQHMVFDNNKGRAELIKRVATSAKL